MSDVTRSGSALITPSGGYSTQDYELGKFRENNGTITIGVSPTDRTATYQGTIVVGTGKSAGTLASSLSGIIRSITQVTPDLTGTGTATTILVDGIGGTIVSLAAQAESATVTYGTTQPISTAMNWITSTSGTGQASPMNIIFAVHYEK